MQSLQRMCVSRQAWSSLWEPRWKFHFISKRVKLSCVSGRSLGWIHVHVSLKDTRPVIVSSLRDIELNSGITFTVNCSASGQPAPLHGEITLVKPDKTTVYVSWSTVTSSLHFFSTSFSPLFCFNSYVIQREMPPLLFFSGSGHTDRKESDDVHIQGGENHCICCWPLVVSGENQPLSGGERIHGDCQRWDSSTISISFPAKF